MSIRVVSLGQGTPAITHVVTASSGTGGGIAPSGSISVSEGGSVSFEVTPDSDNRLSGITGTCPEGVYREMSTRLELSLRLDNHT